MKNPSDHVGFEHKLLGINFSSDTGLNRYEVQIIFFFQVILMLRNIGAMHQMCVKQNCSGSGSLSHQYILHCRTSLALLIFKIYLEKHLVLTEHR